MLFRSAHMQNTETPERENPRGLSSGNDLTPVITSGERPAFSMDADGVAMNDAGRMKSSDVPDANKMKILYMQKSDPVPVVTFSSAPAPGKSIRVTGSRSVQTYAGMQPWRKNITSGDTGPLPQRRPGFTVNRSMKEIKGYPDVGVGPSQAPTIRNPDNDFRVVANQQPAMRPEETRRGMSSEASQQRFKRPSRGSRNDDQHMEG